MALTYSAYAVYTYGYVPPPGPDPTPGGNGMAGLITDNGGALSGALTTYADMENRLDGDPKVEAFGDAATPSTTSDLRVVATDRDNLNTPPGVRNVYIYDPVSFTTNQPLVTRTWPPIVNLYTVVRLGNYLYAIDYDLGRVIEINGTTPYAPTGITYQQPVSTTSGYPARGQELIVVNGELYGLFAYPDSNFTNYDPSVVVRFNVSPGVSITAAATSNDTPNTPSSERSFEKNAFALAASGTNLYVASIGGRQGQSSPNPDSRLQRIPVGFANGEPAVHVMSPSDLPTAYEFRDISFDNRGRAYVFAGTYNTNWNMDGVLFSTTNFSNLTTFDPNNPISNIPGYFWSAQYTSDNNRVWFAHGNDVYVYDAARPTAAPGTQKIGTLSGGGAITYDSLNDLCYIGVDGGRRALRGYKSHWQKSNSPLARAVRAITKGRPEPTAEELAQAQASLK
jgi:hypothetical protein